MDPRDTDFPNPYLPEIYKRFEQQFPQVLEAFSGLAEQEHAAGPLNDRDRRLVKLGLAIGASSRGGVKSAVRHALRAGLSADEIRHATVLGVSTIGFPATIAAFDWVDEVLDGTAED